MSIKQYLKSQVPVLFLHLLGMLALALFLTAEGSPAHSILFISFVWLMTLLLCLTAFCLKRKKYLDRLLALTRQLDERYLIPEVMAFPQRADDQVFYQILKMAEKSMLEKTGQIQRERKEYKEYIEQWIHEVKTPITAINLLCENNRSSFTRELSAELEKIERFTQQALYYARSEHPEKDYCIRKISLQDTVHAAISDNKYLLRRHHAVITVSETVHTVYTDEKWVRFILNQLISNAVKYRAGQPVLHFDTAESENQVCLTVTDYGIGISPGDLPRIFEKGFTGQNGRAIQNSTGIGLYLCKRLCEKLGIGLDACSNNGRTSVTLSFHVSDFITGIQA